MKPFYILRLIIASTLLCIQTLTLLDAQSINKQGNGKLQESLIPKFDLFTPLASNRGANDPDGVSYFSLDKKATRKLLASAPNKISFSFPLDVGEDLEIKMESVELFSKEFKVLDSENKELDIQKGIFYQYSSHDTTALLGVYDDQVIGNLFIGSKILNLQEAKTDANSNIYALLPELNDGRNQFNCGTQEPELSDDELRRMQQYTKTPTPRGFDPLDMYYEIAYDKYIEFNKNTANLTNWLSATFFIVKTIYKNKIGIELRIQVIKIWDKQDFYNYKDEEYLLGSFKDYLYQHNFTADFAQLITKRQFPSAGGKGIFPVPPIEGPGARYPGSFCIGDTRYSWVGTTEYYSNIPRPYTFPDFNYPAKVMAHELGHNLGARHTHSCIYTGHPLDNCATPEGNCGAGPPPPASGGHFMSYCKTGIDFNTNDPRYNIVNDYIRWTWQWPCHKNGNYKITPTIQVYSPNSSNVYKPGESITVKWNLNVVSEVQIILIKSSNLKSVLLSPQEYGYGSNQRTYILPKDLASGNDYYIKVDILDRYEMGIAASLAFGKSDNFTINNPLPDLKVSSGDLTVTGTPNSPKFSIQNVKISNTGNLSSNATRVGIYISKDIQIDKSDQLLTSINISAISAGNFKIIDPLSMSPNVDLIPAGSYYIGLIVDPSNLITESNELNNTFYWSTPKLDVAKSISLSVSPQALNFSANGETKSISISSNINWNITKSLSWLTVNPTSGSANGNVNVVCSPNSSANSRSGNIIVSGGGQTITIPVTQAGQVIVNYPDLTCNAGDLQINKTNTVVQVVISNLKILNQGSSNASANKTAIYLSTDQTFDASDKKIGSIDIEALTAGSFTLKQADISINSNTLSVGKYYVGIIVDNEKVVTESNENNNVYYWTTPVVTIDATPPSSCICDIPGTAKLLICENFQNRKDGAITPQSTDWRLWDTKSADGIVTTNSSGYKSLLVQTTNNQDCDALLLLGNRQQGTYELSWNMYIPSGNGGYFNMQSDQNKVSHAFEVFLAKGATSLKINNADYPSSVKYNSDAWNAIKLILDVDNQSVQLFINNQKAAVIFYPYGQIGAIDFFAFQDINTRYWIDDICFYKTGENLPSGKPDLTVQEGLINIVNTNGLEVQINNLKIINQGKVTANASQAVVYASTNNSITTGDIPLGTIDIESLAPNSTTTKQFKYLVDQNLAPGEYYIGLLLDPSNAIDEEQEGNNMYYWPNNKLQVANQSSCPKPSNPYIKSVTSTAFYLDWIVDPTVDRYIVQLSSDQGQSWSTTEFYSNDGTPVKYGIVYYNNSPGAKYFFRIKSKCGNSESDWSSILEISLPTNSANDEPCNAQSIAGDGYFVLGNLSSSSISNYSFPCAAGGRDVWFKINSKSTSMRIEVKKLGLVPGSDFALAVYTGSCDGLQLVDCNDDGGSELYPLITLNNLTIGRDYFIRVWDSKGLGKDFWINAYQSGQGNNTFQSIPHQAIENPINRELASEIKNHTLQSSSNVFQKNQLSVIPNPSNGVFVVNYEGDQIIGDAKLVLRDFLGRICYQQEIKVESSFNTYQLSINDVPNGVYSFSLLGLNGKGLSTKLIISK